MIVGGESGSKARPCDMAWIRSIRDQCDAAGAACFVKQVGAHPIATLDAPIGKAFARLVLRDPKGGDPSEWPEDLRVRQFPESHHAHCD